MKQERRGFFIRFFSIIFKNKKSLYEHSLKKELVFGKYEAKPNVTYSLWSRLIFFLPSQYGLLIAYFLGALSSATVLILLILILQQPLGLGRE